MHVDLTACVVKWDATMRKIEEKAAIVVSHREISSLENGMTIQNDYGELRSSVGEGGMIAPQRVDLRN